MTKFVVERVFFDYSITAEVTKLDEGMHILLTGGSKTHIGAICYKYPQMESVTLEFPSHKEGELAKSWVSTLSEVYGGPIFVFCGIHYKLESKDEIKKILKTCDELLNEIMLQL